MHILFLCTHNACRSILAEAVFNARTGGCIQASSAGSHPSGRVHPDTLSELVNRGYSVDGLASTSMDIAAASPPDVVVTVCDRAAGEACPVWLDKTPRVHWGLPDPTHPPADSTSSAQLFEYVIETLERRAEALGATDVEASPAALASQLIDLERI